MIRTTAAALSFLLLASLPALGSAQGIDQKLDNGFTVSPQRSPQIDDFSIGVKMMEQAAGDPTYEARLKTYRECSEKALRTLAPYKIEPAGAMIYTAVRQCTRPLHDYVRLFGSDPRFKANIYVGHGIMRMTQQDQMDQMRGLAAELRASVF